MSRNYFLSGLDSGTGSIVYNRNMGYRQAKKSTLQSAELARLAGVSTDTLRHYERKGLLCPARAANGYRQYPASAVDRVLLIRRALATGFRLDDLVRVLQARDQGGVPCREVRALAATRLDALETQIRELTQLRDDLKEALRDWDRKLAQTPAGERARLLEALVSPKSRRAEKGEGHEEIG